MSTKDCLINDDQLHSGILQVKIWFACLFICLPWQPGLHVLQVLKWKISKDDYKLKNSKCILTCVLLLFVEGKDDSLFICKVLCML